MNTRMPSPGIGPFSVVTSLTRHRALIGRMAWRDIQSRYRGSLLGTAWTVVVPFLLLMIYTFVFGFVLKARWSGPLGPSQNQTEFAVILFSGLIPFWMFGEVIGRAPGLVRENINYVTKIVFPIFILPWVAGLTALFNMVVSLAILLVARWVVMGTPPATALLAPLALVPLVLLIMGLAWFCASIGMFVRDLGHIVSLVINGLMFLSPIFYPAEALPEGLRPWLSLNPLTIPIEAFRDLLLWGRLPDPTVLGIYWLVSFVFAWAGLQWFLKTQKGFSDVV